MNTRMIDTKRAHKVCVCVCVCVCDEMYFQYVLVREMEVLGKD